jgi:hypothetical protein
MKIEEALRLTKELKERVVGKRWSAYSVSGEYFLGSGAVVALNPETPTPWQTTHLVPARGILKRDDGSSLDVAIICLREEVIAE